MESLYEQPIVTFNEKHTDVFIEQTRKRPQQTLDNIFNTKMEKFSISTPLNFSDEGNWLLAVTSFEAKNSAFNITNKNNSFSITLPGHWCSRGGAETINKLRELQSLEFKVLVPFLLMKVEKDEI